MQLTAEQARAIDAFRSWLKAPYDPFRLFGAAGTGKTTLAQFLVEGMDGVEMATFTGKAASVLRRKGCPYARTIHSLIYKLVGNDTTYVNELEELLEKADDPAEESRLRSLFKFAKQEAGPRFAINPDSDLKKARLLILDECSMIPEPMARDLMSFGCPILVLGDPYQLPPVRGQGYFTKDKPDVLLEQIHRQAQESGILRLATKIREGHRPDPYENFGKDALVVSTEEFVSEHRPHIRPPDQVIVGTHKTRKRANKQLRDQIGHKSELPVRGDRVICTRNNHTLGLLNGEQFKVSGCDRGAAGRILFDLETDDGKDISVTAFAEPFLSQEVPWQYADEAEHFDFGNAITCHKSQGSEWTDVVVIDEGVKFKPHIRKWRYTAVTRASENLIYVV